MTLNNEQTASDALLQTMRSCGIEFAFAVLGTDHPGLIESFAKHSKLGSNAVPKIVVCQHENVAINAALGAAHFSGQAQAVIAHVDVGTLNLGIGFHSASRNRLPVLVYAGVAPFTELGERRGGRDSYINYPQDVYDQAGSVREYAKWEYQVRSGSMFPAAVARGLQLAQSRPQGPVYLTSAREPLEELFEGDMHAPKMPPPSRVVPDRSSLEKVVRSLRSARNPVLITMAGGREPDGAEATEAFADTFGVPVCDMRAVTVNLRSNHPFHYGHFWEAGKFLESADFVLIVECDAPWIPSRSRPDAASVVWLGEDPTGSQIPMRTFEGDHYLAASPALTLKAMCALAAEIPDPQPSVTDSRRRAAESHHCRMIAQWDSSGRASGPLTASNLAGAVAAAYDDDTLVVQETTTNAISVLEQLRKRTPGTLLSPAGSGLGFGLPAAFGAKLARPEREVLCLQGDGSYLLAGPTACHWNAAAYDAPFLTVIFNNRGWRAIENATLAVHPKGFAAEDGVSVSKFPNQPNLSHVIEGCGGRGFKVHTTEQAFDAIERGRKLAKEGISTVVDAVLE
jgi:acetolactate synthase-1/2/3 large subunit